jgi:DNA-directed RNA polymerase subunit K/omega
LTEGLTREDLIRRKTDSMSDTHSIPNRPKNAFELVTIAAARAKQLLSGCLPKVDGSPKPARRALQEVNAGVVGALPTPPVHDDAR